MLWTPSPQQRELTAVVCDRGDFSGVSCVSLASRSEQILIRALADCLIVDDIDGMVRECCQCVCSQCWTVLGSSSQGFYVFTTVLPPAGTYNSID